MKMLTHCHSRALLRNLAASGEDAGSLGIDLSPDTHTWVSKIPLCLIGSALGLCQFHGPSIHRVLPVAAEDLSLSPAGARPGDCGALRPVNRLAGRGSLCKERHFRDMRGALGLEAIL